MGTRRFGRVNWRGLYTLILRESQRFLSVWKQTLVEPVITLSLFITIFYFAIGQDRTNIMGVSFINFLAAGILMMTVIQNSFANTSSSIVIAKVQGNIVDSLMPPLSAFELAAGYIIGGALRGLIVALIIAALLAIVLNIWIEKPLWWLFFITIGSIIMSALGALAGIFANRFDQMAAISNFIIAPLSFLSGTFYSISQLPEILQKISHANPIFYMIDGARYGMIGQSDSSPITGLFVCLGVSTTLFILCWLSFYRGYRLKN